MARYRVFDFDKLQADFLKSFCKDDKQFFGASDGDKCYISNGHMIGVMPAVICGVNLDHVEYQRCTVESFKNMFKNAVHDRVLIDTGITKKITGATVKVFAFQDNPDEVVWLDEKYCKYFEKMNCQISGSTEKSCVIFETIGDIVGMILPINQ